MNLSQQIKNLELNLDRIEQSSKKRLEEFISIPSEKNLRRVKMVSSAYRKTYLNLVNARNKRIKLSKKILKETN